MERRRVDARAARRLLEHGDATVARDLRLAARQQLARHRRIPAVAPQIGVRAEVLEQARQRIQRAGIPFVVVVGTERVQRAVKLWPRSVLHSPKSPASAPATISGAWQRLLRERARKSESAVGIEVVIHHERVVEVRVFAAQALRARNSARFRSRCRLPRFRRLVVRPVRQIERRARPLHVPGRRSERLAVGNVAELTGERQREHHLNFQLGRTRLPKMVHDASKRFLHCVHSSPWRHVLATLNADRRPLHHRGLDYAIATFFGSATSA